MKTEAEIVTYLQAHDDALFDFSSDTLTPYLSFEAARPWLKDTATPEAWAEVQRPLTREAVVADMREYMEFAWGKVQNHRGLSAGRSVSRMCAWLWLLDNTDALAYALDDAHYPQYGAPILWHICEQYGFPYPSDDPRVARMAQGQRCVLACAEGCG